MTNDKIYIKLHLYNTELALTIKKEQEEYYRSAAKLIIEKVNSYSKLYTGKRSEKDILFMSMLDIAFHYKIEEARNNTEPFIVIFDKLTSEIEETIKSVSYTHLTLPTTPYV